MRQSDGSPAIRLPVGHAGTYTDSCRFTIIATDNSQASLTGQLNYSMLVTHALAVRPAALPVVTVGDTFSKQKASGGSGSGYTFSAPRLPGWLTWDCHRAVRPAR